MQENYCSLRRWDVLKSQLNNLSPEEFYSKTQTEMNIILIDVRTHSEYELYHLPNAINLDYLGDHFLENLESLDKAANYYIYCRSGRRSVRVCTLMQNSGFLNLYNLDGGLNMLEAQSLLS